MKSFSSKSPFSFLKKNESIPLIIFIFIFLGVGLYFFINKLTEKQQQSIADAKSAKENDELEGVRWSLTPKQQITQWQVIIEVMYVHDEVI